jgi:hypothetical protein
MAKQPSKPRITEADVQKAVTDLLVADGWRAIRTDPVSDRGRGKGFGEVGMPDYLYLRYAALVCPSGEVPHWSQHLWIEFKRYGAKLKPHQIAWHVAERSRGALVLVVDGIDDKAGQYRKNVFGIESISDFISWYRTSGLARKVLRDARH